MATLWICTTLINLCCTYPLFWLMYYQYPPLEGQPHIHHSSSSSPLYTKYLFPTIPYNLAYSFEIEYSFLNPFFIPSIHVHHTSPYAFFAALKMLPPDHRSSSQRTLGNVVPPSSMSPYKYCLIPSWCYHSLKKEHTCSERTPAGPVPHIQWRHSRRGDDCQLDSEPWKPLQLARQQQHPTPPAIWIRTTQRASPCD